MPYVLTMDVSSDQADALHHPLIHAGRMEQWYLQPRAALALAREWLPLIGRAHVRLSYRRRGVADLVVEEFPPAEVDKPVVPGVIECTLIYTRALPPFLPFAGLPGRDRRRAIERYLEGCTLSEIKQWLRDKGQVRYLGDSRPAATRWLFVPKGGQELVVDLVHEPGQERLHFVY